MKRTTCPRGSDERPHLLLAPAEIDDWTRAGRLERRLGAGEKRFCICRWPLYRLDGSEVAVEMEEI